MDEEVEFTNDEEWLLNIATPIKGYLYLITLRNENGRKGKYVIADDWLQVMEIALASVGVLKMNLESIKLMAMQPVITYDDQREHEEES